MTVPVTVLVPVLNESGDIEGCLDSLAAQEYPSEKVQIVVVDGGSADATIESVHRWSAQNERPVTLLSNERPLTASSLNVGLAAADGDVIVRVDARARIGPRHLALAVAALADRTEVAVVGGGQWTRSRSDCWLDRSIARGLNNRLTTGFSRYRIARSAGSSDTVWMGAFRSADLRAIGGWDESVRVNEDWELASRFRGQGRVVWFDPGMTADYLPRRSLGALSRQYRVYGRVKGSMWRQGVQPQGRQLAIVAAPLVGVVVGAHLCRRLGWRVLAATVLSAGAIVEELGSDGAASPAVRIGALATIVTYSLSWWVGVVEGVAAVD